VSGGQAQQLKDELLFLVDEDTAAFNKVMAAFGLPKDSAEEKGSLGRFQSANKYAAEIPLRVMETASKSYELLAEMADKGNPASISDVGVGLLATRACIDGAAMNVRINLSSLKDENAKSVFARTDGPDKPRVRRAFFRQRDKSSKASCEAHLLRSLAVLNTSQLITLAGPKRPRVGKELGDLAIIERGGMLIQDGVIAVVGRSEEIEQRLPNDAEVVNAQGRAVLPGFVDAHAHPVFGGNRVDEFEMRARGATYEEIAASGGGIRSTVRRTRAASEDDLLAQIASAGEEFSTLWDDHNGGEVRLRVVTGGRTENSAGHPTSK
jgi:hypothetical protein